MTKEHLHNFVKHKLSTDEAWALRALVKIYESQTPTEKTLKTTNEENGVGFTGTDSEFLSGMAEYYLKRGNLSSKQMQWVMKKMHKYHNQIVKISDRTRLEAMAAEWTP